MKKKSRRGKRSADSLSMDPREIIQQQVEAFKSKFGRPPKPDEPLIFDPSKDQPTPMETDALRKEILEAMKIAGTPPEIVYAYTKTGLLLNSTWRDTYPPEIVTEWDAAIEDYFRLEGKREHSDTRPSPTDNETEIPQSNLPALKDIPFTDAEKRLMLDCLDAIDGTITQPTSLRMKLELAATLLVHACAAAYESAAAHGQPKDAEMRYETFEQLVAARARELFNSLEP
ncbi:MAG: hypothetical protein JSR89_18340 [Proteobacteria bacterium]|nr:hypothetical protein [Pseudomonadota bacterium]